MQSDGTGLGVGSGAQPAGIVIQSGRARAAKPEEIYRAWLELAEPRISAEQVLLSGFTLSAGETAPGLRAVLAFFDGLAAQVFTRKTDVGELSNYMAGDVRRWRDLLRAFRQRSAPARDTDRYHQLTRALAATEFLASDPITDAERTAFALENIDTELAEGGRSITITGEIKSTAPASMGAPNVAICLRDDNGDVCGERVIAASGAAFSTTLAASAVITDVEVSFTRAAVT
jgi:hypothetical protein